MEQERTSLKQIEADEQQTQAMRPADPELNKNTPYAMNAKVSKPLNLH